METFIPRSRSQIARKGKPCKTLRGSPDHSDDSIPSVIFPQSRRTRILERPAGQEISQDDQRYLVINFFIFFSVVIQIITGIGIICLGIFFITMNYRNGLLGDLQANLSIYIFEASGMLLLIGAYITSLNYNFHHIPNTRHLKSCIVFLAFDILCLSAIIGWGLRTSFYLKDKTFNEMSFYLKEFYASSEAHRFFNRIQDDFGCCGLYSRKDWEDLSLKIPHSCCDGYDPNGVCSKWKDRGCYEIYYAHMYCFVNYVIGFSFVTLGVVLVTLTSTIATLCYGINKHKSCELNRSLDLLNNTPGRANESFSRDDISPDQRITNDLQKNLSFDSDIDVPPTNLNNKEANLLTL